MGGIAIVVGVGLAIAVVVGSRQQPGLRVPAVVAALLIVVASVIFSSVRFVGVSDVGLVVKNAMGPKLPPGRIIAVNGQMGPQAKILPPGWHFGFWPVIYDVEKTRVIQIDEGEIGLITTTDGQPLPPGEIYAPEWTPEEFQGMINAEFFLGEGGGVYRAAASEGE